MKKIKTFIQKHSRIVIASTGILAICVLAGILWIFTPEISIDRVHVDSDLAAEVTLEISGDTEKLDLKLDGLHKITLPNGDEILGDSYTYDSNDFEEGDNTVTIQKVNEYGIVKFASSEKMEIQVFVDRIPPTVEIVHPPEALHVLQDATMSIKTEIGATAFAGETKIAQIESEEQDITLPTIDGANELSIRVVDPYGNAIETEVFTFDAFRRDGYALATCLGYQFPYNTAIFDAPSCNERGMLLTFNYEDFTCSACDYVPDNISLYKIDWLNSVEERIAFYENPQGPPDVSSDVLTKTETTSKSGIVGTYLELDYRGVSGEPAREVHFIFAGQDAVYDIYSTVKTPRDASAQEQAKEAIEIALSNLHTAQ